MTRDEIFSNELEYLYFRLVAARNALNEAKDPETEHCLYDILTQTLDKIDRKGSEEDRNHAAEIVVRKNNKYARYILNNQKLVIFASIGAVLVALGAIFSIVMILMGSETKLKPSLIVAGIAAVIIIALAVVVKVKKKNIEIAREHLKGKTVIGARINTLSSKERAERAAENSKGSDSSQPRVVYNFKAVIVAAVVIIILVAGFFVVKNNGSDILIQAKKIMASVGLNPDAPDASPERFMKLTNQLEQAHDKLCYDRAMNLLGSEDYEGARELLGMIPANHHYEDAEKQLSDIDSIIKYNEAMNKRSISLTDTVVALSAVPVSFKDTGELLEKYRSYLACKGSYVLDGEKFVITDFIIKDDGQMYLIEESLGEIIITESERRGPLFKAIENPKGKEVWWFVSDYRAIRQEAGASTMTTWSKE